MEATTSTRPLSHSQDKLPDLRISPPPVVFEVEPEPAAATRRRPQRQHPKLLLAFVLGALVLTCIVSLLVVQATDDPWAEAFMQTPRNSHTLTLLPDGRVLAAGGWDGASPLASAELYDPASGAWKAISPMSDTRAYPAATLLPDGRVLVAGGWNTLGVALASAEIYDPKTDTWRMAAAMRFSRAEHTTILLPAGLVLVVGGYGDDGLQTQAELYDPATNAWTPAGALHIARSHHTATLLPKGQVLIAGGWDDQHQPLASTELYEPASNTWTPAAALTTARLDHTATLLPDGTVLAAGGYNGAYLASAEVYDPAAAAWTATGSMSVARAYHAAVLLRNGKVLVAGGADGLWPHDTAESYHPQARNWTPTGRLHKAYEAHLALLLNDDKVLIAGRPDSGDRTGNGGHPTPTPTVATPRPPDPLDWLLTPLPTATRKASQSMDAARNDNAAEVALAARDDTELAALAVQASSSINNYTTGATAKLYGVHEVSFVMVADPNPYAITRTVLFTSHTAPSQSVTVMAFYDGPLAGGDLWRARVYVNRIGAWTWTPPAGAWNVTGQSFTASEDKTSGLRGMLRVSSSVASVGISAQYPVAGAPKRWYTDDGRTFLPLADSAYRLFFQRPGGSGKKVSDGV